MERFCSLFISDKPLFLFFDYAVHDQMCADSAAGLLAEAVAEPDEHNHDDEGEAFWEDACREEDGIEYSMGDDRCTEHPEPVD